MLQVLGEGTDLCRRALEEVGTASGEQPQGLPGEVGLVDDLVLVFYLGPRVSLLYRLLEKLLYVWDKHPVFRAAGLQVVGAEIP